MSNYVIKDIYQTNDSVQVGNYACTTCSGTEPAIAMISQDENKLPKCPICGDTYWVKF